MGRTKKKEDLINLLLDERDFISSDILAENLKTSTKTIYRWVKTINESLDKPLIVSEKGRGYRLDYTEYLKTNHTDIFSPEQRRWNLTHYLLLTTPRASTYYELMNRFYISESILISDEKIIQSSLKQFNLCLVKKNKTLKIDGSEKNLREALVNSFQQYHLVDIVELEDNSKLNINAKDYNFILLQIEYIEKQMNDRIPYPYNVNIFLHLYIMLERSRNFQVYLETNEDYSYKDYDSEIWRLATQIISNLSNYIGFKISENEIFYLNQYLVVSRLHKDFISEQRFPDIVIKITNYYIDNLSCCLDILDLKELIFLDLANHINPMIKRLKNKIHVKNSLLNQIKLIYGLLFKEISKCSKDVEEIFSLNPISDDENGFITLYFAKMMELNLKKIKCIIVCSTGIGISELLKAKISKSFSEIEIIDVLSAREFMKEKLDVDLVISTISLDIDTSQFLLISGMFTEDDKELLKRKVREIRGG